jgi:glycosyltransferase involved in cell wall biosynthesis
MVQRAIRSIIQSASGAEDQVEILVSDNSPDVSEDACRKALDPWRGRSLYIGNPADIGIPANLNQCIARATGRHVLFACDDDVVLPDAVPAILHALSDQTDPAQVFLFGVHAVDEEGRILRRQEFRGTVSLNEKTALHQLLSDAGFALFPGVVVDRDAYAEVGQFDVALGNASDLDMWVRLFARYGVRCMPSAISAYTVHAGSATRSTAFDEDAVKKLMDVFERARRTRLLSTKTLRRCQTQYLHQAILNVAYLDLRSGDVDGARKAMSLFDLESVRSLGRSWKLMPVRASFSLLARCPPALVRYLMTWVVRSDIVGRVRAIERRSRARSTL